MSTIDSDRIRDAYNEVRDDNSTMSWLVCKYQGKMIYLDRTGEDYDDLKGLLKDNETAFVYARIIAGDELSKRAKFVFIVWAGHDLEVLQRAKLSIDRSLVKKIIQNFALELTAGTKGEVELKLVKEALAKAGGADYGTGERE